MVITISNFTNLTNHNLILPSAISMPPVPYMSFGAG